MVHLSGEVTKTCRAWGAKNMPSQRVLFGDPSSSAKAQVFCTMTATTQFLRKKNYVFRCLNQ